MTTRYKTQAIAFKKNDINESDRVFSVFTNNFGQLDVFAKAIRKITSKLRGGIDVFFLSEIEFIQGKSKKTLTDTIVIEKFSNISQDLEKLKIAISMGEILDNFIEGEEKDQALFNLLNESFHRLNDDGLKSQKCELVYYYFLWNALSLLGYHSEVEICAGCHGKLISSEVYFSGKEGGVICGECAKEKKTEGLDLCRRINSDIVKILRIILFKNWQILSKLKIDMSTKKLLSEVSENALRSFCPSHY